MLSDLLRALAEERPHTMTELAVMLGTDPTRLRLALEHCQQLGYLERLPDGCEVSKCGGCPAASSCAPASASGRGGDVASGPTWWQLTDSGRRVVRASTGSLDIAT